MKRRVLHKYEIGITYAFISGACPHKNSTTRREHFHSMPGHFVEMDWYCDLLRLPMTKVPRTDANICLLKTLYRAAHGKPFPAVKQRLWTAVEVRFYSKLVVGVKKVPKTAATMRALHALCTNEMRRLPGYKRLGVPRKYTRREQR